MSSRGITKLDDVAKRNITKINDKMASNALRVMGLAYKKLEGGTYRAEAKNLEKDLVFVGLMGMIDPPRREAIVAVQKCKLAGIKLAVH